jgi:uncharacterized linocin/CFP29 family protein
MNHLHRTLAPVTDDAWRAIEDEAREVLSTSLAGRHIVDVDGPLGWQTSSVDPGRTVEARHPIVSGVTTMMRQVHPLIEIRVPFELSRTELDAISRGARDPDLDPLVEAARAAARAEDTLVFFGMKELGQEGLMTAATETVSLDKGVMYADLPDKVMEAMGVLKVRGVEGPYALVLGLDSYEGAARATHSGGYPVLQHLRTLIDGPVLWAPMLEGSVLVSQRGGDYRLTLGEDFSIGYLNHSADSVNLYLEETLTFQVDGETAAVPLIS